MTSQQRAQYEAHARQRTANLASMLATTKVKKQHHTPQHLLRRFAVPGTEQIRVHDLDEARSYRSNIRDVAEERGYNNIELSVEDLVDAAGDSTFSLDVARQLLGTGPLSVEDWLSSIEGPGEGVIKRLVADPCSITELSPEEQVDLAQFVVTLYFRGPGFRQWISDLRSDMDRQVRELARAAVFAQSPPDEAELEWEHWRARPLEELVDGFGPARPKMQVASVLAGTPGWSNLLLAMPWRCGRVRSEFPLFTADNGVARHLTPARPQHDYGAFTSYDWYVPLAPEVLLKIEHTWDFDPPFAHRRHRDFSAWEASVARHIVAAHATRRLYGDQPLFRTDASTTATVTSIPS
jgi:hypothetical protein